MTRLTEHEFFRFVIFTDLKGCVRGLMPAKEFERFADETGAVQMLEDAALDRLPGVISPVVLGEN